MPPGNAKDEKDDAQKIGLDEGDIKLLQTYVSRTPWGRRGRAGPGPVDDFVRRERVVALRQPPVAESFRTK
jgi:hypothetical protein